MRILSFFILLMWAIAIIAVVRIARKKCKSKKSLWISWGIIVLALITFVVYYFPKKQWIPDDADIEYVNKLPYNHDPASYERLSVTMSSRVRAVMNEHPIMRSAVLTLLGRENAAPSGIPGLQFYEVLFGVPGVASQVLCYEKRISLAMSQDAFAGIWSNAEVYVIFGGQSLFQELAALMAEPQG